MSQGSGTSNESPGKQDNANPIASKPPKALIDQDSATKTLRIILCAMFLLVCIISGNYFGFIGPVADPKQRNTSSSVSQVVIDRILSCAQELEAGRRRLDEI